VLAGIGLTPRRMAAYVSDRDMKVGVDGAFSFVLSTQEPNADELAGDAWIAVPADASALLVREYIGDRATETAADITIEPLDPLTAPPLPTDELIGEQLTSMAWTIAKLTTLHRTIRPELLELPNVLVTAEAAQLGAADTTPDNLYMLGTFRLAPDEALVIEIEPPDTRYWSVTLENIWHECIDPRRRRSSITNAAVVPDDDGRVRIVAAAKDPGVANWIDTGGRHRGFVTVRWLDNPDPPMVKTSVMPVGDVAG
jgi:hypothetical protein